MFSPGDIVDYVDLIVPTPEDKWKGMVVLCDYTDRDGRKGTGVRTRNQTTPDFDSNGEPNTWFYTTSLQLVSPANNHWEKLLYV